MARKSNKAATEGETAATPSPRKPRMPSTFGVQVQSEDGAGNVVYRDVTAEGGYASPKAAKESIAASGTAGT